MANHDLTKDDISSLLQLVNEELAALDKLHSGTGSPDDDPVLESIFYWNSVHAKLWTLASSKVAP